MHDNKLDVLQGAEFRKSSYSAQQGNCVEVAIAPNAVGVRDTKDRDSGHFTVAPRQWHSFVTQLKDGNFDR